MTCIVVLGGAVDTHVSVDRQTLAMNEAGERLTEAVDLSRRYPGARMFLSGGANRRNPATGHFSMRELAQYLTQINS
ncbi:hypothetical protein [Mesorhizobium sp. CA7]|uniref:hypothetical protein n=1 Tax=Mesorhizobium sp. CA7 TaxID=588501 RepID=UPI001CC9B06C|nr:hypothetical protein [Mesorhizobium sp. CA7]MBZ9813853.1 hypothetical protein [Mesorhizobium sp. CA7]